MAIVRLGMVCGEDFGAADGGSLARLVDLVERGASDPTLLERAAGTPQQPIAAPAWLALTLPSSDPALAAARGTDVRLGGYVPALAKVLAGAKCPWPDAGSAHAVEGQ